MKDKNGLGTVHYAFDLFPGLPDGLGFQLEANGQFDTFLDENDQPVSGQLIAVANTSGMGTDGNFGYFLDGELTTASGDIWRYDMTGDGSLRGAGADIVGSEFGGTAERLNGAAALRGASGVFIGAPE